MTQLELFDERPAVASTLPDEGIDLYAEIRRYQEWLITQALVRTQGNRAAAARLLRVKRTTLVMMLRAQATAQGMSSRTEEVSSDGST